MASKKSSDEAVAETTQEQAQAAMDREHEIGARGTLVDPTPNENYTLAGVTSGKPTPETDPEHAAKVRAELDRRRSR